MDFEAILLYNKNMLRSGTSEEVRNTHVLQKRKKSVWRIKSGVIKCTVRARIKGSVKKENKRIRNDLTRLLQEVRAFHERYFSLPDIVRILWYRSKQK